MKFISSALALIVVSGFVTSFAADESDQNQANPAALRYSLESGTNLHYSVMIKVTLGDET